MEKEEKPNDIDGYIKAFPKGIQDILEKIRQVIKEAVPEVKETIIEESDPRFYPRTVNGYIWRLVERFPEEVYKQSKGMFRLLKYKKNNQVNDASREK
jgi:hypothetical protein